MNLNQLEAFVKIANNSSFSKTAKELYLTQPTVSVYITNLEEELGVQLFARTTKVVELTEDGRKLYLYAREMIELSRRIENTFRATEHGEVERELVIAASTIPAQYLLPRILAEYSHRYPQVRFRVVESDSENVIADVADHKADLGFAGTTDPRVRCDFTAFYEDELILVTPNTEKYRDLQEQADNLDWIREEGFILREDGSGTRQEAMKVLHGLGVEEEDLQVLATFANTDAVLMSVKEGMGLSLVSRLAAQDRIDRGELLAFRLSGKGAFRKIYLVTSPVHGVSESARKMVSLTTRLFG